MADLALTLSLEALVEQDSAAGPVYLLWRSTKHRDKPTSGLDYRPVSANAVIAQLVPAAEIH
jgi:hypothetical protein